MDLLFIWFVLIVIVVMMYVFFDGMDLGVGMLIFLVMDEDECNLMMVIIEFVWDGNEIWLILGGGGLFVVFLFVYVVLMFVFYLLVFFMLVVFIFWGVVFEFWYKVVWLVIKVFWNGVFYGGFLVVVFF